MGIYMPEMSREQIASGPTGDAVRDGGLAVRSGGTTAGITDADLDADNGVVHIIDAVFQP